MAISSILPNAQEFIKLPPEDRAWVLIAEAGGASAKGLNIHNLLLPGARVVLEGYPDEHHAAVTAAYRGAWQWLQNTDYLLPEGTSPDFLKISPQGIDWYERHPRTVARKLAEFLRGSSLPFTKGRALTKEVTALLGHAALIGERFAKDIEWSFGSVFLAFLVAGDPLSRWFQDFVRQAKIDLDLIPRTTMAEPMKFSDIRNASKSDDEAIGQLLRKRQHRWHQSAQAIFGEAAALAARIGSSDTPLDVRHIMGALIYRPTQNLIELEGWGFVPESWSSAFLTWLKSNFRAELDKWTAVHVDTFGRNPNLPSQMRPQPESPAPEGRLESTTPEAANSWQASSVARLLAVRLTARVGDRPPYQAMASLVSSSLAVTPYDVATRAELLSGPYTSVTIEFLGASAQKTSATLLTADESKDFAVLRLEPETFLSLPFDPFPADTALLEVGAGQTWESYWVTGSADRGTKVTGTVAGYVTDTGGRRYLQLHPAQPVSNLEDVSGAPVVVGDHLIGIVARSSDDGSVWFGVPTLEMVSSRQTDVIRSLVPSYLSAEQLGGGGMPPGWLSQADINRFSEEVRSILARADKARNEQKKDRIYTEHVVAAMRMPGGQLSALASAASVNLDAILAQDFGVSSEEPVEFSGLPPLSRNVRGALLTARDKADADGSTAIDDTHLLFGVLSQSASLIVRDLRMRGITPDKVRFPAQPVQAEPKPPTPPPEPSKPEDAASAHIATDSWTTDDKLGHIYYAQAIYRFITHEKTVAPLAISIQAPWGGGKTSLMRMVQEKLDPIAIEKLKQEREKRRVRNRSIPVKVNAGKPREEIGTETIKLIDVIKEIGGRKNPATEVPTANPSVPSTASDGSSSATGAREREHRITVWFNAWKYESTEQVWAGLADCILRQVTGRMSVLDRQRFWLRLQLSRLDVDKIQRRIFEKIAAEWWRLARPWALGTVGLILTFFVAVLSGNEVLRWIGVPGAVISAITGGLSLLRLYIKTKSEVENEPADLSLGEYLRVPDYQGKVGFIHEVAEDLNRAMSAILSDELPIVVFIDDLDRCSPQKVAEVTEGINLFLAGEFPDCIFVFGMDAEMVAAALERAHSDVIAKLPSYAASIPVGWRFMDKFVQLPFVIPPPEPSDLNTYIESLLEEEEKKMPIPQEVHVRIQDAARKPKPTVVSEATSDIAEIVKGFDLSSVQQREVASRLDQVQKLAEIDAEIDRASRDNEVMRDFVLRIAPDLFRNPRDLKRFLNSFRLHDFLRIAREKRGVPAPSRDLIAKWIVLSLKWPHVVRWMHRVPGDVGKGPVKKDETASLGFRLRQLEVLAAEVPTKQGLENWTQLLIAALGSDIKTSVWVSDRALFEFFWEMGRGPEPARLSHGAGKGLW